MFSNVVFSSVSNNITFSCKYISVLHIDRPLPEKTE